jgi:hypothetical protein
VLQFDDARVALHGFGNVIALIGAIATALGVGVAWWQFREASRAKSALATALDELPRILVDTLRTIVASDQRDPIAHPDPNRTWAGVVDYVDVNADGQKELVIQYPSGAHGSALKILGWRDGQFKELAQLAVGTPVGFEFGDFDGDGKIEIKTQETDWSAGLPYVSAPRVVLLVRWNGTEFVEVSRQKA